jgi:hypothetical protein
MVQLGELSGDVRKPRHARYEYLRGNLGVVHGGFGLGDDELMETNRSKRTIICGFSKLRGMN